LSHSAISCIATADEHGGSCRYEDDLATIANAAPDYLNAISAERLNCVHIRSGTVENFNLHLRPQRR